MIAAANTDDESFGDVAYFARYLKGLKGKGNEELVTFSALGGPADAGCTPPGEGQIFGSHVDPTPRLQGLTQDAGGVFESICDEAGFNGSLEQIALNLKTLRRYFPLSAPPNPATISVSVDGQPVAQDAQGGWQYLANINAVAFLGSYVPEPGAAVVITYAVAAAMRPAQGLAHRSPHGGATGGAGGGAGLWQDHHWRGLPARHERGLGRVRLLERRRLSGR